MNNIDKWTSISQEFFEDCKIIDRIIQLYADHNQNIKLDNKRLQQIAFRCYVDFGLQECGKLFNQPFFYFQDWLAMPSVYSWYSQLNIGDGDTLNANTLDIFDNLFRSVLNRTKNISNKDLAKNLESSPWHKKYNSLLHNKTKAVEMPFNEVIDYYSNKQNYDTLFCVNKTSASQPGEE